MNELISVFVCSAGSGDRWNNYRGVPKQLVRFDGITLLERIRRQVSVFRTIPFLVTRTGELTSSGFRNISVGTTETLAETIGRTEKFWTDHNVFLLGDVFYSRRGIEAIMRDSQNMFFVGRPWPSGIVRAGHGEMFALSVKSASIDRLRAILQAGSASANVHNYRGNLWNLYQIYCGLEFGSSEVMGKMLHVLDDYTNDIDSPIDFHRRESLYKRIAKTGDGSINMWLSILPALPRHAYGIAQWWIRTH